MSRGTTAKYSTSTENYNKKIRICFCFIRGLFITRIRTRRNSLLGLVLATSTVLVLLQSLFKTRAQDRYRIRNRTRTSTTLCRYEEGLPYTSTVRVRVRVPPTTTVS